MKTGLPLGVDPFSLPAIPEVKLPLHRIATRWFYADFRH